MGLVKAASPPSRPATRWRLRPPAPPEVLAQLCHDLKIPPVLAAVLYSRGFGKEAVSSLQPPLALTPIPTLGEAASRLHHALQEKRRILIHGDYDADGISGTAVLLLGLRALGANVTPFIPNRLTDGYGISPDRVEEHCERAQLFITVDCGISNHKEIARLQAAGLEVIVTDHHQPGTLKPDCLVVHPHHSPFYEKGLPALTGAGVAYHLLWALHERLKLPPPLEYSDLATIGTIADVAPLMGENRALIQEGLARLADSCWPGLQASVRQSRLEKPTARDVAFILAPRLNAAGRLGEADHGLELLTTASERRARELCTYLDALNQERRRIQDKMLKEALEKVDPDAPAIVVDDERWNPGVMGIVASKLLDRFYKPVFISAKGKGSVRSPDGVSAVDGLAHASEYLERYGGHSQAAGFAIRKENLEGFRQSIFSFVSSIELPPPTIMADALLSAAEVEDDLYRAMQELEPYGEGHPAPQFVLTDRLDSARAVGKDGGTLQLRVAGLKGVAWGKGEEAQDYSAGSTVNAAISLKENEWQGKKNLEFVAEALRPAEPLGFAIAFSTPLRHHRGKPEGAAAVYGKPVSGQTLWQVGESLPETLWLKDLPLQRDNLLNLSVPLEGLVRAGTSLYFDLDVLALADLEALTWHYPGVSDLRRAFVQLQRGVPLGFGEYKAALSKQCLLELNLIDESHRVSVRRGEKRDPYSSPTLVRGLIEQYRLRTLLNAYRYLEDASFAVTLETLFGGA